MHQRDVLAAGGGTPSDTLHQVLAAVTVFLMFLAIGFAATAFGKRFRLYSIVTIVVLLVFGGLTFLEARRLEMNLPTPWIGLWERIDISVFLLWVVTLAAVLWRTGTAKGETPRFSVPRGDHDHRTTLIAHAKDDRLASHDASQRAAERIPPDLSASNREVT